MSFKLGYHRSKQERHNLISMTTPELETNIRLHVHIESAHNEWVMTKYHIIKCTHEILTSSVTLIACHKIGTREILTPSVTLIACHKIGTHEILTPSVILMPGHKIDTWQLCRSSPAGFITLNMFYSRKTHTPGLIISPASFITLIMP